LKSHLYDTMVCTKLEKYSHYSYFDVSLHSIYKNTIQHRTISVRKEINGIFRLKSHLCDTMVCTKLEKYSHYRCFTSFTIQHCTISVRNDCVRQLHKLHNVYDIIAYEKEEFPNNPIKPFCSYVITKFAKQGNSLTYGFLYIITTIMEGRILRGRL
jgi:hypothetical protein